MNPGLIVILGLVVLSTLGMPIAFSLGISTVIALATAGFPEVVLAQRMFSAMNSIPLLAIPFFILAGNLMSCGITQKILDTANAFAGHRKGSLGIVTVVASALFSAISGSGVATASAIGGITIPGMKKDGYPTDFAAALASIAATMGPLIPPSIFLIVYGSATESSVAALFMAAIIPGIMMAMALAIYAIVYARRHNLPTREKVPVKQALKTAMGSMWALFMPILILGGIFLGLFSATEAAAVSVIYALFVSIFVYKGLRWKDVLPCSAGAQLPRRPFCWLWAYPKLPAGLWLLPVCLH